MRELIINSTKSENIFTQIQTCLQGELKGDWGEKIITFNNSTGKGTLRTIDFNWGLSLIDCDLKLNELCLIPMNYRQLNSFLLQKAILSIAKTVPMLSIGLSSFKIRLSLIKEMPKKHFYFQKVSI